MKQAAVLLLSLLVLAQSSPGHDVITTNLTFTRDVSRIFARRCIACHGASSSIPLTTYEEARPWAVSIKEQVLSRAMPPWGAVKGFGSLAPDQGLSQEEILIIAAWVIGGAPKGDPKLMPHLDSGKMTAKPVDALKDAIVVRTRGQLSAAVKAAGLRPMPDSVVQSAKITARLPDGKIEPLLWLYRYDPKLDPVFLFRQAVNLPAGTVVESSTPLRFALEALAPTTVVSR